MVFTAYNCEQIYMKRIMVAGGGMGNGNAYAVVEILYNDEQMEEVDSVWYKEFGDNPISKRIGNEVEWCEYDTFKILEDGEYVEEEDKEEEEEEPLCQKCKKCDCGPGAWGGLCVYSTHEEIKKWEDEH
jgi:hypothetical protein